jgi:hypothetical protein
MPRILTDHDEIRQWAEARAGNPMTMDVPDGTQRRTLLEITFGQHALNAENNEGPDRPVAGYELVSWDDWFAEFDSQGLAIRVQDDAPGVLDRSFEFMSRAGHGETTDAARKPAVGSVEDPNAGTEFGGRGR